MNEREDIERENEGRATWESDGDIPQYVIGLFNAFKESRRPWEELWEELWFNYLGQYQESTKWKKNEGVGNRSRVFIKLTQLKANTAHAKIIDVMFSGRSELPFDLEPYGYEDAGIAPDEAKKIAEASKRKVRDHFRRIELEEILDTAILEKTILGTGVIKSPIIDVRKRNVLSRRTIGGIPANQLDSSISPFQVKTVTERLPVVDHVPLWEYYTDINAKSNKDAIGEIHFQRLLPEKFRQFMAIDGFDKEAVREAARRASVDGGEDDGRRVQLGDNYAGENPDKDKRVSVIEYWGLVPVRMLREAGVEVPEDEDDEGDIESLVYLAADGILLKACVNPLGYRPFKVCPYKKRPHVIYGMGPAEMMRDSQKMVNSSARLIVDNKALSGNGMVAVNMERIDKKMTKGMKVYPGKVWYVKGNYAPKDVVDSVRFNDVTKGLRELLELFVRFSDEETGIPKYTHGEQDSFLNKTAHGMSMLMTQANINLKTVLRNIDNYWIEPLVEEFHGWFEEMDGGTPIPMRVRALGTDSLIAKELKMENIMKFLQITSAPQDAILTDRPKMMRDVARILETQDYVRPEEQIEGILKEMGERSAAPKDLRELVNVDKLFALLHRSEQVQILEQLGIKPDASAERVAPPAAPQVPEDGGMNASA